MLIEGVIRFKDSLADGGNYRWSIVMETDELANTSFHISSGNSGTKLVIKSDGNVESEVHSEKNLML